MFWTGLDPGPLLPVLLQSIHRPAQLIRYSTACVWLTGDNDTGKSHEQKSSPPSSILSATVAGGIQNGEQKYLATYEIKKKLFL
jgi:hypothetical protein